MKRKLTKLKELYVDDLISIEDYKKDYKIYTEALQNIPDVIQEMPPNLSAVRRVLDDDFKAIYDSLSREEKGLSGDLSYPKSRWTVIITSRILFLANIRTNYT